MTSLDTKLVEVLIIGVSRKQRNRQCGAFLFQVCMGIAVFGILLSILLQRIAYYQDKADEAAVILVVTGIRAALEVKVVEAKLPGRRVEFIDLAEENPLNLLNKKPVNYAGELFSPTDEDIGKGNWYFDRHTKMLVYLLNNGNSFGNVQSKRLKFKVKLFRLPQNNVKLNDAPHYTGVVFEQVNE